ncbi:MAG TPA: 3'-5' exonuclease [Gemmatimonadaceae bacterium]
MSEEVKRLYENACWRRDVAEGFTALAGFLFNDGDYLRRILATADSAERALALVEIVSVLSLAISYRVTHQSAPADVARIGFAERLRMRLTKTLPVPLAPRPRPDAVHVMTCHASKGLEFPCVVVVGQTLPGIEETLEWVPSSMRPNRSRERAQADALLFVGVTRAQRAVVVSYPLRATAGASGKGKAVVPLLERWRGAFGVASTQWADEAPVETRVLVKNVWDVPAQRVVKASALDGSVCPLLTYLETWVGARFPDASRAMYPGFFAAVRKTLRAVATRAGVHGVRAAVGGVGDVGDVGDVGVHAPGEVVLSDEDAVALLEEQWSRERWVGHPHAGVYRETAERMVVGFARALGRIMSGGGLGAVIETLDPEVLLSSGDGLDVGLDLVAQFRRDDGTVAAVVFRPEALRDDEGSLKWSDLAESKRSSMALLAGVRAGMTAYVYSGRDGRIYEYRWSKSAESLPTLTAALEGKREAFAHGEFSAEMTRYGCDRCRARVSCPQWIGAVRKE